MENEENESVAKEEDDTSTKKPVSKKTIIAAVAIVVVLAVAGVGVALALTANQPEEVEEATNEQVVVNDEKESKVYASVQMKEATETEADAKKDTTKEDTEAIEIVINIYTDTGAKVVENKDGTHDHGDALKITKAEIGKKVEVGSFEKGSYHLHIDLPVFEDGSSYVVDEDLSDLAFEVDGKGKKIELKIILNYLKADGTIAETSAEAGDIAAATATAESGANTTVPSNDTATNNDSSASNSGSTNNGGTNNSNGSSNSGSTGGSSNNSGGSSNNSGNTGSGTETPTHVHNWVAHTKNGDPIYGNGAPIYGNGNPIYQSTFACNICGFETTNGDTFDAHQYNTMHGSSSVKEKIIGYEQVITGYEQIITGYKQITYYTCSCGASK